MKRQMITRAVVALAALVGLDTGAPAAAFAHTTSAYSHDSSIGASNTDWMARLSGSTPLSQITMLGTHDSGASRAGGDIALTQSMSLQTQLTSGIRAWDIRLAGDSNGNLVIYHGIIKQGQEF